MALEGNSESKSKCLILFFVLPIFFNEVGFHGPVRVPWKVKLIDRSLQTECNGTFTYVYIQ